MKSTLLIITLIASTLATVIASDVVITSLTSVTVDGRDVGTVVDVLANADTGDVRARLLDALIAREKNLQALQTEAVAEANAARAEKEAAIKAEQSKVEAMKAAIVSRDEAIMAAVVQDEKEKRAAELQAQIEALQKQKDEINK